MQYILLLLQQKNNCNQQAITGDTCRCLQIRPYIGSNGFASFVAKDVAPASGVQVIKFTPV